MYFLEPKSRWSPGLHTYIHAGVTSDPECSTFSDSPQSSDSESADIMDDVMDLDVPMDLESPEVVQNILGYSDLKTQNFTVNELESVLKDFDFSSVSNWDLDSMFVVPPNEVYNNVKVEPEDVPMDVLKYINPVSPNLQHQMPTGDTFSFGEIDNDMRTVPEPTDFCLPTDTVPPTFDEFVPDDLNGENVLFSELSPDFLSSIDNVDGNNYELTDEILNIAQKDFSDIPSVPNILDPTQLVSEESQTDYNTYLSDDDSLLMSGEDPMIGSNSVQKKAPWFSANCCYVTPKSPQKELDIIKKTNDVDVLMFTHNYCRKIKEEPMSSRPTSPESQTMQPEHPVSYYAASIAEKPIPVKRRPGRPRKNAPPADPCERLSVPKVPTVRKQKRTAPPPAKRAKLTIKSTACNEKRLQHNELERNRRDAMRLSMEGVEQLIPDRILQLTQVALCHERNEKSEEIENDFTVEVFRHVEELISNKDHELRNIKCRKVNTKKGTKFPKMVVLLSAAYYVAYLESDLNNKALRVKRNEKYLRHMRSTRRFKKY